MLNAFIWCVCVVVWGDVFAVVCIKLTLKRCSYPSVILCIGLIFPESLNKECVVGKTEKERVIPQ